MRGAGGEVVLEEGDGPFVEGVGAGEWWLLSWLGGKSRRLCC